MNWLLALFFLSFMTSTASAQQRTSALERTAKKWAKENGVILTSGAMESLKRELSRPAAKTAQRKFSREGYGYGYRGDLESSNLVVAFLERFPILHVVVEPIPPRDYVILINGERQVATEESKYAVGRGKRTSVRVTRAGRPPCIWGPKLVEDDEEILCSLGQ
jgi:hypothetical protein